MGGDPNHANALNAEPAGGELLRERFERAIAALLRTALVWIGRLPAGFSREACARISALYAQLGGARVDDAAINLKIAFPGKSDAARRQLLVDSYANLGRSFAELCSMYARSDSAIFDQVEIEGRENLALAAEQSGEEGALVVTAHFGSWELCAAALAQHGLPVSVVQHGFRNRYVEEVVTGWRNDAGLETLTMGSAAVGVFRALARGRYVALLMDQNAGEDEGVMAPFFAHPASTRSGPASIAMSRGTAVVPVFFFRKGVSGTHTARIGPPLKMEQGETDAVLKRNVDHINAAVEGAIREAPEQWIWSHRRFKTQPKGAQPVYPRRRSALRSLRHALRRRG